MLKPPQSVSLMKVLDKTAFDKHIKVPVINLGTVKISSALPTLKKYLLKVENFKPISHSTENVKIFLNPNLIQKWADISEDTRQTLEILELSYHRFEIQDITLKYDNYSVESILRAVLPKDQEGLSSFTKVGHIVHVNLKENLIPYKSLIGEVLYDKVSGCKSVVNKTNMIDNTYRNFQMEVLKGESNMHTTVKENSCKFEFDFSTVYWNSRLCTEHERIVKMLMPNDVFFDVFAGVGPFSLPAAKKKCIVYANDLNPESYKWLTHNKKLNKISDNNFTGYNLDGREFILTCIKEKLPKYIERYKIYITMNLPAMAVEFLEHFIGLFKKEELPESFSPVTVFVYCFSKGENPEQIARDLVKNNLKGYVVDLDSKITDIFRVRTVSSMKEMMRVTLKLDRDILVGSCVGKRKIDDDKIKVDVVKRICEEKDKHGKKQEKDEQCVQGCGSKKSQNES